MGINAFTGIGRIVYDLELRTTTTGISVCDFVIAINGYKEGDVDFINCQIWKMGAENLVKYQSKGSQVGVCGKLKVDTYNDKDNNRKTKSYILCDSVQFLDTKKDTFNDQDSRDIYEGVKSGQDKRRDKSRQPSMDVFEDNRRNER